MAVREGARPLHRVDESFTPATCARRRWPRAARYWTASTTTAGSSCQTEGEPVCERSADDHGREAEAHELVDAGVVHAEVAHEDAVDTVLAPPAAVQGDLLLDVGDELKGQRDRARRELRLDAGDELHEERLERERAGGPRKDQPARVGPGGGERARGPVRVPAEVVGYRQDPLARLLGNAGPPVQRVRTAPFETPRARRCPGS